MTEPHEFTPRNGTVQRIIPRKLRGSMHLKVLHADETTHTYLVNNATGKVHGKLPNKEELEKIRKFRKTLKQPLWPKGPRGYNRGSVYVIDPGVFQSERVKIAWEEHQLQANPKRFFGRKLIEEHQAYWQEKEE